MEYIISFAILALILLIFNQAKRHFKLQSITMKQIDRMTGHEFETYLEYLFTELGYKVKKTKATRDFGVDLIIQKEDEKIAIQAKRYRHQVNLQAVQEVVAGKYYYGCNQAWVVTNSYYKDSAKALAIPNNVVLLNRNDLAKLIENMKKKNVQIQKKNSSIGL